MLFPSLSVNEHDKTVMEDPHPTYKRHNQLDIPETAPFDLTFLVCVKACFRFEAESLVFCSCATKKKKKKSGGKTTYSRHTYYFYSTN